MEWLQLPEVTSPAEWLAWDEALLEASEGVPSDQPIPEKLWFWEAKSPFVVLGYGQKVALEVNVTDCEKDSVPILRRCSGGGTVVQGPGCLNYGLILEIPEFGPRSTITGTNAAVMNQQRAAMESLLGQPVVVRGHTDLAILRAGRELKFSGNAQRRKRRALLFHGTILLNFELEWITRWLRAPSWAPEYRAGRAHEDFVTNTRLARSAVETALAQTWGARVGSTRIDPQWIQPWMDRRYSHAAWHAGHASAGPDLPGTA